jgi:hypothetical protein
MLAPSSEGDMCVQCLLCVLLRAQLCLVPVDNTGAPWRVATLSRAHMHTLLATPYAPASFTPCPSPVPAPIMPPPPRQARPSMITRRTSCSSGCMRPSASSETACGTPPTWPGCASSWMSGCHQPLASASQGCLRSSASRCVLLRLWHMQPLRLCNPSLAYGKVALNVALLSLEYALGSHCSWRCPAWFLGVS